MSYYVKENKNYDPYLNEIIRKFNSNPSSSISSRSNYGSASSSSSSSSCNSGGKGWTYSPYTQGNCDINTFYNSR